MSSKGQSIIEYSVILVIIIVVGLLVIGLSSMFIDNSEEIGGNNAKVDSVIGLAGISIQELVLDQDGDGAAVISSQLGDIILTKITVNGVENDYSATVSSEPHLFLLRNLTCVCLPGDTTKTCNYTFTYTRDGISANLQGDLPGTCVTDANNTGTEPDNESDSPVIALSAPADENVSYLGSTTYTFTATDASSISSCDLLIDGSSVATDTDGTYGSFTYDPDASSLGARTWNVQCTDEYSNEGSGTARDINFTYLAQFATYGIDPPTNYGLAMAKDSSDNVYLGGGTIDDIDFGNGVILTTPGGSNLHQFFIVKYNSAGDAQWVKTTEGDVGPVGYYQKVQGLYIDSSDNIYATGITGNDLNFGNDVNTAFNSGDNYNFFVVKYNSSGTAQWARTTYNTTGGGSAEEGFGIYADASGNVYVAGRGGADMNFGGTIMTSFDGTSYDFFVVKYNSSGTAQWVATSENGSGDDGQDHARDVYADASGNVYVTGYTNSTAMDFGNSITMSNTNGSYDFFFTKYNSSGTAQWVATDANTADEVSEVGYKIYPDSSGNLFVAGYTAQSLDFGNGVTLTNSGSNDFFVTKYNTSGVAQMVITDASSSGDGSDVATDVYLDSSDNIYVTGYSFSDLDFGNSVSMTNDADADFFITMYNSSGTAQWMTTTANASGAASESSQDVLVDSTGSIYFVGTTPYRTTVLDFGNGVTSPNLRVGLSDFYLVKYQ
jgi:hypothetical protein